MVSCLKRRTHHNHISFVLTKRIAMNGMNEKTQESHECKRQHRLQKQHEQKREGLACETLKSNVNEGWNSAVKRKNLVSKVTGLKREARKHRSDSKPNDSEIPADVSVKQPNQTARRLLDHSEGNTRRHEND